VEFIDVGLKVFSEDVASEKTQADTRSRVRRGTHRIDILTLAMGSELSGIIFEQKNRANLFAQFFCEENDTHLFAMSSNPSLSTI